MTEKYECYQCGEILTETYWRCYYVGEDDDNIVCGNGDCWAMWIQENMEECTITEEE